MTYSDRICYTDYPDRRSAAKGGFGYLDSQDVINTVRKIISYQDISMASVARRAGKSTQVIHKQLTNSDIKLQSLLDIISALHCDITITIRDRATDKEYHITTVDENE